MSSNPYDHMVGKTYTYMAREYVIKEIQVKGNYATVITDKKTIQVELRELKNDFLEVETEDEKQFQVVVYKGLGEQSGSIKKVTDVLMEAIEKVKTDPKYIKQADAIGKLGKIVIDGAKTQIQAVKLVNDLKK